MGSKAEKIIRKFPDYLWVGTIIFTLLGVFLPAPFLSLKPAIKPLLGSVIAAMGLTLSITDFKPIFRYPKRIFVGWLSQYLVMPLAGFAVAYFLLLPYSKEWVAGQVLTGGCPTGVVSNVYTYLASGNVALSVTLSALNTLVAPFITPWYTQVLAGKFVPVNPWALFIDMVKILLLPVLAGMLINTFWGKYVAKIRPYLPVYSTLAVITIVGYVAAAGSGKILSLSAFAVAALIIASILHLFIGYGGGLAIAKAFRLNIRDQITISTETAMQNSGLATVLAVTHWGPMAALPAVVYSVVQNIIGPFVVTYFRGLVEKAGENESK